MADHKSFQAKDFKSHPLAFNGTLQTILARYWWQLPDLEAQQRHLIELADGDKLLVYEYRPSQWHEGQRIAVLVHGLVGCYQSNYMIRMTKKLNRMGINVFRVNLRSNGPGLKWAKNPYHAGRSSDTLEVIKFISKTYPRSPITQLGYSLGANITLKMAGEFQQQLYNLDSVVAVSPPANITESVERMLKMGRIFNQYFVNQLKKEAWQRHKLHHPNSEFELPAKMNIVDFDHYYLAPRIGYKSAYEYYKNESAENYMQDIQVPVLLMHSNDDPVISGKYLTRFKTPSHWDIVVTDKGGHVGFLDSRDFLNNFRWMDTTILNWLDFHFT
ncbi:MAG: alpha/beta fold hydrolase [Bdellovibrionales bacterium]|nr:alpha/beta fold hydrolase [Bdellovibrionales bacterium]